MLPLYNTEQPPGRFGSARQPPAPRPRPRLAPSHSPRARLLWRRALTARPTAPRLTPPLAGTAAVSLLAHAHTLTRTAPASHAPLSLPPRREARREQHPHPHTRNLRETHARQGSPPIKCPAPSPVRLFFFRTSQHEAAFCHPLTTVPNRRHLLLGPLRSSGIVVVVVRRPSWEQWPPPVSTTSSMGTAKSGVGEREHRKQSIRSRARPCSDDDSNLPCATPPPARVQDLTASCRC